MGYGLPAAVGAQLGLPEKTVILFTGDGSIMMNCQEMATAANNNVAVKIIVLNNQKFLVWSISGNECFMKNDILIPVSKDIRTL